MRPIAKAASLISTILAAASIAFIVGGAPASAAPRAVVAGVDLGEPSGISPGARWWTYEGEGSCSVGWIVHNASHTYAYSAGHCAPKGVNAMLGQGTGRIGQVVISQADEVTDGDRKEAYDVAAIQLTDSIQVSDEVPGFGRPSRLMTKSELREARPDICSVGQKTGLRCGPFEGVLANGTTALARLGNAHGDSGGPAFAVSRTGEVLAIGTLVGVSRRDPGLTVVQLLDGALDPSMSLGVK